MDNIAMNKNEHSIETRSVCRLAVYHLQSARFFSEAAKAIDDQRPETTESVVREYRAHAIGAVFCATASLEAMANEIYLSAVDGGFYSGFGMDESTRMSVAELWPKAGRNWPVLKKYQKLLAAKGAEQYKEDRAPYAEVDALVKLRNTLTHFKPEWDDAQSAHAELEKLLSGKFEESYFSSNDHAFIPHRCFGAGCACWSVKTTIDFIKDVRMRLGLSENIPMEEARAHYV